MFLFRELWDKSALNHGTVILLGRGFLTVALLWLSAACWQNFSPPVNLPAFGLGVLATGLLSLLGWSLWLGPFWLASLVRGLPNRPN
jgi:hypothetical protein